MREFDEQTLSEAVIQRMVATPDARLRQLLTSLLPPLHGCVQEVRPGPLHVMRSAPGHERLGTHRLVSDDPSLDGDAVFAVQESLVVDCTRVETRAESAPYQGEAPCDRLPDDFVREPTSA